MENRMVNVLTPLAALVFACGAQAFTAQTEGFESIAAGQGVGSAQKFVYVLPSGKSVTDQSTVTAYSGDMPATALLDASESGGVPASKFTDFGSNYLELSTEDGTLLRSVNDLKEGGVGDAATVPAEGIDIDTVMQFAATDPSKRPVLASDDKFSLWLEKSGEDYVLMAYGGKFTYGNNGNTLERVNGYAAYSLSFGTEVEVTTDTWYRVTIQAIANANDCTGYTLPIPGFKVFVNGVAATATRVLIDDDDGEGKGIFDNDDDCEMSSAAIPIGERLAGEHPSVIPSIKDTATLAAVGFTGDGKLDDLVINDNSVHEVNFAISVPAGMSVLAVTNGTVELVADSEGKYTANAGAEISVLVKADGDKIFVDGSHVKSFDATAAADSVSVAGEEVLVNAGARIGDYGYATLNDALSAVNADDLVVELLKNEVASNGFTTAKAFAFTIDLGGHTYSYATDVKDRLRFYVGSRVTVQNGTIMREAGSTGTDLLRSYADSLTISNVVLDCANGTFTDGSAAVLHINGEFNVVGSSAVSNAAGKCAIHTGNYAGDAYVSRTCKIDTTGTISGDIIAAGGQFTINTPAAIANSRVYYGTRDKSAYVDGDVPGYVVRTGDPIAAGADEICGELFKNMTDAKAVAAAGDKVTLLADAVDLSMTYSKSIVIDCNGHKLANSAKQAMSISDGADFTLMNGELQGQECVISGTAGKVAVANMTNTAFIASQLLAISAEASKGAFVTGCSLANATSSLLLLENANTVFYVHGNTFGKKGVAETPAIGHAGRPQVQVSKVKAAYIEGNIFKENADADYADDYANVLTGGRVAGLAGAAIGIHANYHNNTPNSPIVVNGNDFTDVSYVIGIDSEDFDNVPFAIPELVFGANDTGTASLTTGVYKYKNDVLDYAGKYSAASRLTLPDGVVDCYGWATGANSATPFYVNSAFAATLGSVDVDDVVIAAPGTDMSSLGSSFALARDATYANKWTVVAAAQPIVPGETNTVTYATAEEATNACAAATIQATDAVQEALNTAGGTASADYLAMFEKKVVATGDGKYTIKVVLSESAEETLETEATNNVVKAIAPKVAAAAMEAQTANIATTPGFYYSVNFGTALGDMSEGDRKPANGYSMDITLPKGDTAGFYQLLINLGPKKAE